MVNATLEDINAEMLKYTSLADEIGDTEIIKSSKVDKYKITSDELFFEEENVYMYLTFNVNIKKINCVFYLTEIDSDYAETLMSRIGLPTTEENIQNLVNFGLSNEEAKVYTSLLKRGDRGTHQTHPDFQLRFVQ